jgi:putative ATP-dependent DNA ligase
MEYVAGLGLTRERFDAVADRFQERTFRGRRYHHLRHSSGPIPAGTAIIDAAAVRGFPSIPRTLVLEAGVKRYFDGPFVAEEKLNGYNVRVARVDEILGFTRSGTICPFTTSVVRETLDLDPFFDAHPEAVLCGEMIGPENPYTTCDYPEVDSIGFFAFDIRHRESGEPVTVAARRDLCETFDIPQAPGFGAFTVDETDTLQDVVADLETRGREGIVMKSPDGERLLKYTTSAANQGNLVYGFAYPFDYGREYVFPRILREAFRAHEVGDDHDAIRERAHDLGEAILEPFVESIRVVENGGTLSEAHTVRGDPVVIDELLEHLHSLGLHVWIESDETLGGERLLTFTKQYRSSTDSIDAYLDGQTFRE